MATSNAAIYARISSDDGSALGVQRQVKDCSTLAASLGWTVEHRFIDNDVSASNGKKRPQYQALIDAITTGQVGALIVWDVDRLTRTPAELEHFILLADTHQIALASVGGDVDLATPQGRLTARIKGSVARHEVEQSSRRLRRKFLERAEQGKPHGKVAFGYVREPRFDDRGVVVGFDETLHPEQSRLIREGIDRLLAGETLRSIVADFNSRGLTTPRGTPWTGTTLRQVLMRERNAGRRVHQGQVIGRGDWPPVVDDATFDRFMAKMRDSNRRTNAGAHVRHLLSGLAKCGRCGGTLRGAAAHQYGSKRAPRAYFCSSCYKLRRKADSVDEVVEVAVVERLSQPDAAGRLFGGDATAMREAQTRVDVYQARLDLAADQFAEGAITGSQLERITARLRPELDSARAEVQRHMPSPEFEPFTGDKAVEAWLATSIDRKRAIIAALVDVTILPSGAGRAFDPEQVKIEWKASA